MAGEVHPVTTRVAVERAMSRADARSRRSSSPRVARRLAPVLAATMVFGISNVALAAAANPSVPGDALYGVDRAYERIGALLGAGGFELERLDEAAAVLERGEPSVALGLVEEALSAADGTADAEAARNLADRLSNSGAVSSDAVSDLVEIARGVAAD